MADVEDGVDDRDTHMRDLRPRHDRVSCPGIQESDTETLYRGLVGSPGPTDPQRRLHQGHDRDDNQWQRLR